MTSQALLVTTDDAASTALTPVLSRFGLGIHCCEYTAAIGELSTQKFDALVVDFDDPQRATLVLQNAYLASPRGGPISVALLAEKTRVRSVFGAGAKFILYKPISSEAAEAALRAAVAFIRRERRRSLRVPVQVPVQLHVANGLEIEGILLDLSEDGLEVLSSQPLFPYASLFLEFILPGDSLQVRAQGQVVWASPNGQTGIRFVDLPEAMRAGLSGWVSSHARTLAPDEFDIGTPCQLTDLSQGGCYMETESPFPERSSVVLHLKASGAEVQAEGMVRVVHPGFGMGVEFASCTRQQQDEVASFIRLLTSHHGVAPELVVTPRALADSLDPSQPEQYREHGLNDPLLDLLRSHEPLSQEDFLGELRRQRSGQALPA